MIKLYIRFVIRPNAGATPAAAGRSGLVRSDGVSPRLTRFSEATVSTEAYGASPEITAPHRSYGGLPKLRSRSDPSERHRSYGEAPKPRSGAEATEALRSYGETPILR
jgi:hypothetical protein